MTTRTTVKNAPTTVAHAPSPEPDFDDTIARNRVLPLLDPSAVPSAPKGFRATDPDVRNRRLRKLSAELRAETCLALKEAGGRDLRAELGKHAPDPARAPALLERVTATGQLVAATQTLAAYAREVDQIALSDALVFLEAENKELAHAMEHEPEIAAKYAAVRMLFTTRAAAIAEGKARAPKEAPEDKPEDK